MAGVIYNADLSENISLIVPDKLYRFTEITMWRDLWEISGFELKFEVPANYEGYAPIYLMIGTTRDASRWGNTIRDVSKIITYYYMRTYTSSFGGLQHLTLRS